ncbi:MAG: 50S ribosomal protein L32 [Actinobacteria bacterium HGW-Actinobacteria-4]|nr:MAG: 50S ribosomal protein L32 [Actinobacteria bacterium HGW-Actinobacteria-4]
MAVPKRKMSRSNTRSRRSQWKTEAPTLVPVVVDGVTYRVPRALVRAVQRGYITPDAVQ